MLRRKKWLSVVTLCLLPLFAWSCTADRAGRVWIDADFASGQIALKGIELLPLRLAVNIDGAGRAALAEVKAAHETVARLVDEELRRVLSDKGYQLARGQMSKERLLHILSQIDDATKEGGEDGATKGVTPVLVEGGIPGTDAVMVLEGEANITTGGKKALQATVIILLVALIVAIVVLAVALASKGGGGKGGGKGGVKGGKAGWRGGRGGGRVAAGGRVTPQRSAYRNYRQYYRTHRAARTIPIARATRYYQTRYRYGGRWVRYRSPYIRPFRAAAMVMYFSPVLEVAAEAQAANPQAASVENKQPFFSGSYLDMKMSLIEKGTGLLLWFVDQRWKIEPNQPAAVQQQMQALFAEFPAAREPQSGGSRTPAPVGTPPPPPGPTFLED